jgi:hypothetical protein
MSREAGWRDSIPDGRCGYLSLDVRLAPLSGYVATFIIEPWERT